MHAVSKTSRERTADDSGRQHQRHPTAPSSAFESEPSESDPFKLQALQNRPDIDSETVAVPEHRSFSRLFSSARISRNVIKLYTSADDSSRKNQFITAHPEYEKVCGGWVMLQLTHVATASEPIRQVALCLVLISGTLKIAYWMRPCAEPQIFFLDKFGISRRVWHFRANNVSKNFPILSTTT